MAAVVLITGATGLLGRYALQHWDHGRCTPLVLDSRRDDLLVPGTPRRVVERERPDVVLHLAWCASGSAGYRTSPDNERWVEATLELADGCAVVGARLVATGTALDAGESADAYSRAKRRLREALWSDVASGVVGWLRPYYVVAPDHHRPEVVAAALVAAQQDQPVELRTPHSAHDFVHAEDVGRAAAQVVAHALSGEIPIGSGRLRTVRELVEALGVPWRPAPDAEATAPHHHDVADTTRLGRLGWSPTRTEELFHRD